MSLAAPRLQRLRFVLECLSFVAVILAVPFFFIQQYREQNRQAEERRAQHQNLRAEAAMGFIQMANDAERWQVRAALTAPFENVDVEAMMARNPSAEDLARDKLLLTQNVRRADIEKMTDFYKSVLLCRNAGHCDGKLVDDFFQDEISSFYCAYDVRLEGISKSLNRADYSDDLKAYSNNCEG